ncbi:GPCR family 2-like protein [Macrophomina phaseolina MS6]|uniref:GPCR family 2-like protein n=1 Tax=Macrophomina phaseolina (strain MS6) TaxID=1126212 RepID=K2RU10_MACPH|nr:GPCR family 2-like protein [Macrophomina phaseolina MS6]
MTAYEVVSRASSGISIVGAAFIVVTFLLFPTLRRPMNRLIFYASAGNIVLYIFYCIGTAGIPAPGRGMALCRVQAFSIQTFSTSAMLFTMAMAINVYLIFFRKWAPSELRRLEPLYLGVTYGFTVLHSLVFLILDMAPSQSGIYGPANLWCWVTQDYQWIRFTFGYGITWVGCVVITVIYVATGAKILRQNLELKHGNYALDTPVTVLQVGNPFQPTGQPILCVTEVQVTSTLREPVSPSSSAADFAAQVHNGKNPQEEIPANRNAQSHEKELEQNQPPRATPRRLAEHTYGSQFWLSIFGTLAASLDTEKDKQITGPTGSTFP